MKQRLRRRLRALQRHPGSSRGARRGPGSRKRSFRGRKHPQAKAAGQAPVRSCCPPAGHRGSPAERERALAQAREAGARQPLWASPHGPMGPTAEHASTRQHLPVSALLGALHQSSPRRGPLSPRSPRSAARACRSQRRGRTQDRLTCLPDCTSPPSSPRPLSVASPRLLLRSRSPRSSDASGLEAGRRPRSGKSRKPFVHAKREARTSSAPNLRGLKPQDEDLPPELAHRTDFAPRAEPTDWSRSRPRVEGGR